MHPLIVLPNGDTCECPANGRVVDPARAAERLRAVAGGLGPDCLVLYPAECEALGGRSKATLKMELADARKKIRELEDQLRYLRSELKTAKGINDLYATFAEV